MASASALPRTTQQLVDALTAHLSLYHASNPSPALSSSPPSPRAAILRWLASLPPASRAAATTSLLSPAAADALLSMLDRFRVRGHSSFFVLASPSPAEPTVLSRLSRGLLARAAAASRAHELLFSRTFLFASSPSSSRPDAITVAESLLADLDAFVAAMDEISGGRFLRCGDGEVDLAALASEEFPELPWLKAKGYYVIEEFVANWVEIALRMSWVAAMAAGGGGGKKAVRVGKCVKEKAGLASTAFWREKGYVDWWMRLEPRVRARITGAFFGKSAVALANEIGEGPDVALRDKSCLCLGDPGSFGADSLYGSARQSFFRKNQPGCTDVASILSCKKKHAFANELKRLLLLQEIVCLKSKITYCGDDAIFLTPLMSTGTVSDLILMRLRRLLMVVSTESINFELIGDGASNTPKKKDVEKTSGSSRKGKKKTSSSKKLLASSKSSKDNGSSSTESRNSRVMPKSNQRTPSVRGTSIGPVSEETPCKEIVPTPKEQVIRLGDCNNQCSKKKNKRKGKAKLSDLARTENPGPGRLRKAVAHAATEAVYKSADAIDAPPCVPSHVNSSSNDIPEAVGCSDSSSTFDGTEEKDIRSSTKLEDSLCSSTIISSITTKHCQSAHKPDNFSLNEQGPSHTLLNGSIVQPSFCSPSRSDNVLSGNPCRNSADSLARSAQDKTDCDITQGALPGLVPGVGTGYEKHVDHNSVVTTDKLLPSVIPANILQSALTDNGAVMKNGGSEYYAFNRNLLGGTSYEWPSVAPHFVSPELQQRPAAADRLHLDVGYRWPTQFDQPFLPANHQVRSSPIEAGCNQMLSSRSMPLSFDWPPVFRGYGKLTQNAALSYDPVFAPHMQSSAWPGFPAQLMQRGGICSEKDRKYFGDSDPRNTSDVGDDAESYWCSEEESDGHAVSGRDINQYFGGGVMYWSPAEHAGTGFSRPPSLSSDDSAWAWHEADVSRVVDDLAVGIPSTYSASSPPSTPFCPQNETSDPTPQPGCHSRVGADNNNEALHAPSSTQDSPEDKTTSAVKTPSCASEIVKGDTLPYAMLRPIVVPNISRRLSRSDFRGGHDHRSPCVSSARRDIPLVRRPPSPVLLSVPRVPRPPPPSPVGESRKRGFPIVRSGSSSPRHWGMRSLFPDDKIFNRAQFCLDGPEVVWPSWVNKGTTTGTLVQTIEDTVLQDHLVKISHLSRDQHPDVALPLQPSDMLNGSSHKASLSLMHNALHEEIDQFCKQVAAGNLVTKPYINWAVKRVTRCLQVLWPRSRTNLFGSNATGLALPTSDVDLVVSLPPVRNLEPIKEAGILEGRNGIKETCLQHAARCLGNQDWVRSDSLKTIENTAIPVIMLVAQVPCDINMSTEYPSVLDSSQENPVNMLGEQGSPPRSDNSSSEGSNTLMSSKMNKDDCDIVKSIRLDISFKSPSHTGLQTTELVRELTQQFPAALPLALIMKKFLADRSLDHPYSGGLSSYCLVLLITRFLQHEHHLGRPINQNLGSLLMDFLYFFGNVFDPRHMRISIQGSGIYLNRERGHSIDPIHIDDPLCPANNVGRNCFRIHQCIKAFADAFAVLENELLQFTAESDMPASSFSLLKKIIPSIDSNEL